MVRATGGEPYLLLARRIGTRVGRNSRGGLPTQNPHQRRADGPLRPRALRLLAPSSRIGSERDGNRPASSRKSTRALGGPIRTNAASQAGLSPIRPGRVSLVVVQAVAGSSPVAHPQPEGPHVQAFRGESHRWREALTPAQAACTSELGADAGAPARSGKIAKPALPSMMRQQLADREEERRAAERQAEVIGRDAVGRGITRGEVVRQGAPLAEEVKRSFEETAGPVEWTAATEELKWPERRRRSESRPETSRRHGPSVDAAQTLVRGGCLPFLPVCSGFDGASARRVVAPVA
jgi:hypothetical protein